MNTFKNGLAKFVQEDDGAQVVEYALIIAVVSIALVVALGDSATGITSKFGAFVTRVAGCLAATTTAPCV